MTRWDDPRTLSVPDGWRDAIDGFELALKAAGRSDETIIRRLDHLRRTARAMGCAPGAVTAEMLADWCGAQSWGPETRRSIYQTFRQFWRWAAERGLADGSAVELLPKVRAAEPKPRPVPDSVVAAALVVADTRVGLILRCAIDAGMRRGEIAQIHARDLCEDLAGWSVLAHGKGARDRLIPLPDDLARDLAVACAIGGGWAFPGRIDGHLSADRVGDLATAALPDVWTLHTLRHGFATRVHEATGDLVAVQRLLGHASVATTQRYVATDAARLRRAVELGARRAS